MSVLPVRQISPLSKLSTKPGQAQEARGSDLLPAVLPLAHDLAEKYFADRYPGFDLDDPDWPAYRRQVLAIEALCVAIKLRLPPTGAD